MSRSTFRVLFYLKRNAPKKNGLVPVMCRITVNGKIAQFSYKLDVEEKLWNVSLGIMSRRSIVAQEANRMLDKIRVDINKAYQEIMDRDGYVSAEKVRNLDECEVQRCLKLYNGISMDVYALPMIIALSFRLNTLGAYKVRECVMNKLTAMPRNGILFLNVRTHECVNECKYGHN